MSCRDSPGSISEGFGAFGASLRQLLGVPGLLPNVSWMLLDASWAFLGPLGRFLGPSWTIPSPPGACRDPLREGFGYLQGKFWKHFQLILYCFCKLCESFFRLAF